MRVCEESPEALVPAGRTQDVGPIQALVDELEFNVTVAARTGPREMGGQFSVAQFQQAVSPGAFSLLPDAVKGTIAAVYASLMQANAHLEAFVQTPWGGGPGVARENSRRLAEETIQSVDSELRSLKDELLRLLGHGEDALGAD